MVFPESHLYWTFHFTSVPSGEEGGQIGFRTTAPGTPPTLGLVEDVGDAFSTFWVSAGADVPGSYEFYRTKCALVLPSGRYDPDFDAVVHDRTPAGGAGGANTFPLQTAHVITLLTDRTSGAAHQGRVYLPPINNTIANGVWNGSYVTSRLTPFATFITAFNALISPNSVQIFSEQGAGARRQVTAVRADGRADVQRRRARQLTSTPVAPIGV